MDRQIHPNSAMNDASAGLHFTTSAKLSSSPLLARNATLNLIAEGWTFLTLIVAFPKLVAYLGNTRFGLFSLAWVVIGYLAFLDIGVNRAATKFLSEYLATGNEQSVPQLVRLAILTNLGLGLLGGEVGDGSERPTILSFTRYCTSLKLSTMKRAGPSILLPSLYLSLYSMAYFGPC